MSLRFDRLKTFSTTGAICACLATTGCTDLGGGTADETGNDPTGDPDGTGSEMGQPTFADAQDAAEVEYRDDLAMHPGCSTEGLSYSPAAIDGYKCAAKDYTGAEDPSKPIILLIHGNSDTPSGWEAFDPEGACDEVRGEEGADELAEIFSSNGFRTLAIDMRFDRGDDPDTDNDTENAAKNMDHGWGVPLAMHFIRTAMEANPDRRFVVLGFSFGVTTARDALRRLLVKDGFNAFAQLDHAFYMAGANHGVSSFPLCGVNPTMRGRVTCEMGDRAAYSPTPFLIPLNGAGGAFETPCGDGEQAFGEAVCDGAMVEYTTVVMQDLDNGEQQDLFVSEASSALQGADNRTIGLNDFDKTNYFFCGLFRNHYGTVRNATAHAIIAEKLGFTL